MPTTRAQVQEFLACRRIALVGASRNPHDFSRYLLHELVKRGYEVAPVNPAAGDIDGHRCFARVQDIAPPVEGALLMTPPHLTEEVVRDCAAAGVKRVWMHSGGGRGSVSKAAVEFCRGNGIALVEGHCPLMFLHGAGLFHRVHGFVLKVTGKYPASGDLAIR